MAELSNAFIARLRTIDVGFHMPLVESMILRAALLSDGNAVNEWRKSWASRFEDLMRC